MAKPQRPQEIIRIRVRRRHRTWMYAMILACVGWGICWSGMAWQRFSPTTFPGFGLIYGLACAPAGLGLFLAIFTVRARTIWVLLPLVPILSNLSLLALPWVLDSGLLTARPN